MDHFQHIYHHRAADYHRMITPEDTDNNLLPALEQITPLTGQRILDLGTGTGRFPLLLADRASQFVGLDLHAAMLVENKIQQIHQNGGWELIQGDMRGLPLPNDWANVALAGWSIGHLRGWYAEAWQTQIGRILGEIHRVVAPRGALIIFETLTTGSTVPAPPSPELAEYYTWLENEWGFTRQQVSTDYHFDSVDEAVAYTEFFFGVELSTKIRQNGWSRLPEWTGIWSKRLTS